jgi:hypothetical protein
VRDVAVTLTRKFGYPGRIDSHERVWLTLAHVAGAATLTLNGHFLGDVRDDPFAVDVTALLRPHNQLDVQIRGSEVGEAALEIRAAAFLQGVRARRGGGKLHVEGRVAGVCDRPLELYVLVDGRHALYRTIDAGESFAVELEPEGQTVRVDLIHVSTVWHVVELDAESDSC